MIVIKRDGREKEFDSTKIYKAIMNANGDVEDSQQMDKGQIDKVMSTVQKSLDGYTNISTKDINKFVERALARHKKYTVLNAYKKRREEKENDDSFTYLEKQALSVIDGSSVLRGDNANKCIDDNGSISDYLAGLLTKSINNKIIDKDIMEADEDGLLHWHDKDYSPIRPQHNCDLEDAEDMLNRGFQMQRTFIKPNKETPFRTICNLLAQINLIVSGRQYGGQTISWSHTLPFIHYNRIRLRNKIVDRYLKEPKFKKIARKVLHWFGYQSGLYDMKTIYDTAENELREEIYEGVKTYQYQILCHSSANGQTPFVSNNLCLVEAETEREQKDFAMLIEEILKRRKKGILDEHGHYVTPLFPKLLYWTCDNLNVYENDPYFYLTELATHCEIERTQPDIVSEKETRRVKEGQIIPSMGCRSLLSPIWEEETYPINKEFYWTKGHGHYPYLEFREKKTFEEVPNGDYPYGYEDGVYQVNYRGNTGWLIKKTDTEVTIYRPKVYGRWNNGVVTVNLPHVALEAREVVSKLSENPTNEAVIAKFYEILAGRLELCRRGLQIRYEFCSKIKAKNSSILWQYGALARMKPDETVGDFMKKYPKRASISLGYVGLYETCRALIGESNTSDNGRKLSKEILIYMNNKCEEWKKADNINYSIYGTPEESLTHKFALANRRDFGVIPYITDKDYVVNSYHVDPRENIDAFTKLEIEGEYLALSAGGAVSYVETLDLHDNPTVITRLIQWMHNHIVYAEFNRKIGICYKCGYHGDIKLVKEKDGSFHFVCPECGNTDDDFMDVTGRLCGYLGKINAGNTNRGRLDDIYNRIIHLDNFDELPHILDMMAEIVGDDPEFLQIKKELGFSDEI